MNRSKWTRIGAVAVATLSATVAMGLSANAAQTHNGTRGTCSESSHIKLMVTSQQHNRLQVRATITHGQQGDGLAYVIADNGVNIVEGLKNTKRNGTVTVRRSIPNLQGMDTVLFTSTNTGTGEVCTAQVTHR